MKTSQLLLAVVAIAAVALVAALSAGDGDGGGSSGGGSGPVAPQGSVRVSFAYSPEKEKLLKPLIRRFNSQRAKVNGKPVFVEGEVVSSGEAESKLASSSPPGRRRHRSGGGCSTSRRTAAWRPTRTRRSCAPRW
jgi:Ca-activated chloride channel family protein